MNARSYLLATGLLAAACGGKFEGPPPASEVIARPVGADLPKTDPIASAWQSAPEMVVKLMPQDQAPPKLDKLGVETVRVRALHDDGWVAFRLEWDDPTKDELVAPARFGDMAAVQLPTEAGANLPDGAMGQVGRPVQIHLWKASNELRLAGKDPIAELYPNALPDHYPANAAGDARKAMEIQYSPARGAHNPVAVKRADSPTEDLIAEGFGSLTAAENQVSLGRGVHDGKTWKVVIAIPLEGKQSQAVVLGNRTYAAFAVWQGADKNVGSRKMRSGWVPLSIEVKK